MNSHSIQLVAALDSQARMGMKKDIKLDSVSCVALGGREAATCRWAAWSAARSSNEFGQRPTRWTLASRRRVHRRTMDEIQS